MLDKVGSNKKLLFILALINFIAGIYSLSYYGPQLQSEQPLFWIFVADCPFYAVLMGVAFLLIAIKKSSPLVTLIALVGVIKYSLWSFFILTSHGNFFGYELFYISHALLLLETVLLFRINVFRVKHYLAALLWFLGNDVLDYAFGKAPFFNPKFFWAVFLFSLFLTLFLTLFISITFSKKESAVSDKNLAFGNKINKEPLKGQKRKFSFNEK